MSSEHGDMGSNHCWCQAAHWFLPGAAYLSPLLEQVFLADLLSEEPGSFADRIKEQFGLEGTFKGFEEEDLK